MVTKPRLRLNTSAKSYIRIAQGQLNLVKLDSKIELRNQLEVDFETTNVLELSQGRIGIFLAIKALVKDGYDEVVLSPYTLYEVINMVIYAGGKPVFSDTDVDSPFVSKNTIDKLITNKTAAVILTHYHQTNPELAEIRALCDEKNTKLIEDCAIAYGTSFKGKKVGMHGHIGVFSFGLFKNVSAFFGGALVSSDDDLFQNIVELQREWQLGAKFRLMKRAIYGLALDAMTHPIPFSRITFPLIRWGHGNQNDRVTRFTRSDAHPTIQSKYPEFLKSLMRPEQAQIILDQLPFVQRNREKRIENAKKYHFGLQGIDGLVLPKEIFDESSAWLEYPIVFKDRIPLYKHFLKERRDIRFFYYRNCSGLDIFKHCINTECINSQRVQDETLTMPIYPTYGDIQIKKNIDSIKRFFDAKS